MKLLLSMLKHASLIKWDFHKSHFFGIFKVLNWVWWLLKLLNMLDWLNEIFTKGIFMAYSKYSKFQIGIDNFQIALMIKWDFHKRHFLAYSKFQIGFDNYWNCLTRFIDINEIFTKKSIFWHIQSSKLGLIILEIA